MDTPNLQEATMAAPIFSGTEEEILMATQLWSSLFSTVSYSVTQLASDDNKKAMLCSLQCYIESKMNEINNVTVPPTVTTMNVTVPANGSVPVPQPATDSSNEVVVQYESVNPVLKRMRELAGIPHPTNRV